MRLVFYHPHIHDFLGEPLQFRLLKRRALKKYEYIITETLKKEGRLTIFLDDTFSVLIPQSLFFLIPSFVRKQIVQYEFNRWIEYNNLQNKVNIITDENVHSNDVLFFFSHKIALGKFQHRIKNIEKFKVKVIHLSHYFLGTSYKSENIRKLSGVWFAGDSDINDNSYFKRFFSWNKSSVIVLPFAIGDRFKNIKPWHERKQMAIATGTFHDLYQENPKWLYKDFVDFFDTSTYHPVRKYIYENQVKLVEMVKSMVSLFRNDNNNLYTKFNVRQKQYFSFDIVDVYNTYQFAIIGEELSGFPAIGAFEAIACGCILVGQPAYYKGTGLIPDVNFISYKFDESKGLIEVIGDSKNNKEICETMLLASDSFIENFSEEKLYKQFSKKLKEISVAQGAIDRSQKY